MKNLLARVSILWLLAAAGCQRGDFPAGSCPEVPDTPPSQFGNPEGYTVHTLSSDSLCSKQVALNGVSVDTSSPSAIDASVQDMIASTHAPTTVHEVTGARPDLIVDFTGSGVKPLPPHFYGQVLQWRSKYFLEMENYRALVRNVRVDMLRFPGGQERVEYLRNQATKPSPGDELGMDQPYQFVLTSEDVAKYIAFCKEMNIVAEPEFNLYNVSPDTLGQHADGAAMAADMVDQIVNELGYDLQVLSAGNEPEVNVFSNWNYLTDVVSGPGGNPPSDPAQAIRNYTARFLEYKQAIEQAAPGRSFTYALGEIGTFDEYTLGPDLDALLGNLGGVQPGALSVHWYPLGEWAGETQDNPAYPALQHIGIHAEQHRGISYLATVAATMKQKASQYGLADSKLILGEWGVAWSATEATSQIQDRMVTAVFSAEVQEFTKTLGFDTLEYHNLSDPVEFAPWKPALIQVDGQAVSVRPQYYVYVMYKYLYGDQIVPVPGGQNDDWSIYAARSQDGSANHLMLINRTGNQTFGKVVEVTTAQGRKQLQLTLYPHSVAIVSF